MEDSFSRTSICALEEGGMAQKGFIRTWKDTHRTVQAAGEGVGEKIIRRMEETQQLRKAIKSEDWVTRDEILIARMGRKTSCVIAIVIWPILASLFWGIPTFCA